MSDGYKVRDENALHFLTFTIVFWIDLFAKDIYRQILIDSLRFCQKNKGVQIFAYVIMTNHMHLIVKRTQAPLSGFIRDFKKYTAVQILESLTSSENKDSRASWLLDKFEYAANLNLRNSKHQVWIQNSHPVELTSNFMIDQRLDYIHMNPVKAGIVENAEEYIYSSAKNYAGMKGLLDVDFL